MDSILPTLSPPFAITCSELAEGLMAFPLPQGARVKRDATQQLIYP
jgi:hypothetical protein